MIQFASTTTPLADGMSILFISVSTSPNNDSISAELGNDFSSFVNGTAKPGPGILFNAIPRFFASSRKLPLALE